MKGQTIIFILLINLHISVADEKSDLSESERAEQLYKILFKRARADQLEAVKSLRKLNSYEKQHQMILLMGEKIFSVILDSRAKIEASPYIPGVSDFPLHSNIKDALSNILENTALFSEIILRFPDISEAVLKANNNWDVLLQWSIAFCNQVKYLLDASTLKLFDLVSQELNHIPKRTNYANPYRIVKEQPTVEEAEKPKKKKKLIKKGPRMSRGEL